MNQYINHIAFVLDASGSMSGKERYMLKVYNDQINYLAQRSKELDQETRASVYRFSSRGDIECLVYDKDVLRIPQIDFRVSGQTALIDATLTSINDLEKTATLYGDHAFLIFVLTDGEENNSGNYSHTLSGRIAKLPENWTVAVLVPDQRGVHEAKKFGFPKDNIAVWDATSERGFEEAGRNIRASTDSFMRSRSLGVRGTKNLFSVDTTNITPSAIRNLTPLQEGTDYEIYPVRKDSPIREYIESWTKEPYRTGSAYYEITKPETVQHHKQICVQEIATGRMYTGRDARQLLGLPDYEIRVAPGNFSKYRIFIQSTSVNRKLIKGTFVVVLS